MTSNKPEIKIYETSEEGVTVMRKASFRNTGPNRYVRLSDYEAVQAELDRERQRRFEGNEMASREHREDVAGLVEALEPFALAWADVEAFRDAGGYAPVTCPDEHYRRAAQVLQTGRLGMNAVDKENLAIGRAIDRAAETLPEGWEVFINIERDAGFVVFCDPDGNVFRVDSGEPFSEQINSAVEAARAGGEA